jgi:hypothetical protein
MRDLQTSFADPTEEKILRRIPLEIAALSAVFGLGAALLFDPVSGVILLAGGLLSALSLLWLKGALSRVLDRGKTRALKAGIALYVLRFLLILGAFFLIILLFPGKLVAFVAGFSAVIPVIGTEAAVSLVRIKAMKP